MLTPRRAAELLRRLSDPSALPELPAALGFRSPLPLDRALRNSLELPATLHQVRVAPGPQTLRVLLARHRGDAGFEREVVATTRALARRAPDRLWLALLHDDASQRVALAAAPPDARAAVPMLVLAPQQLRASDAETVAALEGALGPTDVLVHLRWRETLGRSALTRRFYRELEAQVQAMAESIAGSAPPTVRRALALLHSSRLLFLAFLELRGWLDNDREFLRRQFAMRAGGAGAHRRMLEPLWFGTLNTPLRARAPAARAFGRVPFLNGGLFTRTPLEREWRGLRIGDDALEGLIGGLFTRYRLTAREAPGDWQDAAVDPEMLGRAFESLMHPPTRRAQGSFYTPPALVERLGRDGIWTALAALGVPDAALASLAAERALEPSAALRARQALDDLRVLDPACGSGAFLVFALEELTRLHRHCGDARSASEIRRAVLTRAIHGVDVDPMAVWLCQLRLWLAVVVEEPDVDPMTLTPLPNLDHSIREGDALAGDAFAGDALPLPSSQLEARLRYARASGSRKRSLGRTLEREERRRARAALELQLQRLTAERRELLRAVRGRDLFAQRVGTDRATRERLSRLRRDVHALRREIDALRRGAALPFAFATHFPHVAQDGGFGLVLGNPPWVRTHEIPAERREALRERFRVFRHAAWESGASDAGAGKGFGSQADLAALFVERSVSLARPGGALALLLPAKLWGALAGGGVRALLAEEAPPLHLEDWSGSSAGFDAVVYPSALLARRQREVPDRVVVTVHREDQPLTWEASRAQLAVDDSAGAPWLLLPPEVRASFAAVAEAGTSLATSDLGRPRLGVKCGCNAAFLLERDDPARADVEEELLRPALRGEGLQAWRRVDEAASTKILWTHDARGLPLAQLPRGALRHLQRFRHTLARRSDAARLSWWALFRTEAARHDRARVVWADIGKSPRAAVLPAGDATVPLNTCYVLSTRDEDDAHTLAALLNSVLGVAWLSALAEPARGGYRRFLGWTCARFPLPRHWDRARQLLAPIGRRAARGAEPHRDDLLAAVLEAYDLTHERAAPLLSWHLL